MKWINLTIYCVKEASQKKKILKIVTYIRI